MAEYKHGCRYFIDELKNVFNATLSQFLEDDKEYIRKTACRTFKNEYDWVIDWLIERLRVYAQLWIDSLGGSDYRGKYLHAK